MASYFDPLEALRYLDISRIYDQFSHSIDLIIFFMFFLGLTEVTLGRRYEGRGGHLVCIAVSAALSISILLLERTMSFSLRSFGGIAALMLFIVVGVLLFQMLRNFEAGMPFAFSFSFLALFFSVNAVSPEMTFWLVEKFPFLYLVLFVLVIITTIIVLKKIFGFLFSGLNLPKVKVKVEDASENQIDTPGKLELKEEKQASKKLKEDTKIELDETKTIIHVIDLITKKIEKEGITVENQPQISAAVQKILNAEHDIERRMQEQNDLILKLQSATSPEIKKSVQNFKNLQNIAVGLLKNFRYSLQQIVSFIQAGKSVEAVNYLKQARTYERRLQSMLKALKKQDEKILKLTKRYLKKAK